MAKKIKRVYGAPYVFVLYNANGQLFGHYGTREEAKDDAWGPAFRPGFTIVRFRRDASRQYKS